MSGTRISKIEIANRLFTIESNNRFRSKILIYHLINHSIYHFNISFLIYHFNISFNKNISNLLFLNSEHGFDGFTHLRTSF